MKIRIEEDILSGTGVEIMDQLRARVFDPTESVSYTHLDVYKRQGQDCPETETGD